MIKSKSIFEFDKIYNSAPKSVGKGNSLIFLMYSRGDEVKIRVDKSVVVLNKNDIYILDGETATDIKDSKKISVFLIECKCRYINDVKNKIIKLDGFKKYIMENIIDEYNAYMSLEGKNDKKGFGQMIKALFEQLFILLLRERSKAIKDSYTVYDSEKIIVENIINYLKENIRNSIKFADVIKYTNISATGLKKIFKEHTGMGIMKFYNLLKIEEAKLLLHSGKYNVSQIAEMLGYDSVHYFSKQFKNKEGVSPGAYTRTNG